jgi:hypothetical protein
MAIITAVIFMKLLGPLLTDRSYEAFHIAASKAVAREFVDSVLNVA